jgi:hypothetical protein
MMWTPSSVERKFELRALPNYAREQTIEAILRATALVCVLLLLSSLGLAQKLVTARACIPFNFWAQGQEFKAGDYVFDNALPGSATIRREGSNLSVAIPAILYAGPVDKENAKVLFLRRDGKYFLVEIWGAQGRRVVTSEFQHRGEASEQQRQVPLTVMKSHDR